jgi:hypothetical protein
MRKPLPAPLLALQTRLGSLGQRLRGGHAAGAIEAASGSASAMSTRAHAPATP